MFRRGFLIFLLGCAGVGAMWTALAATAPELHVFTDEFGRTISAELLEANDKEARVRREDGQTFTLNLAKLSAEDTAYIATWRRAHPKFRIRIETSSFRNSTPLAAPSPTTTVTRRRIESGYEIKLANDGAEPAVGLRVEYNLFSTNTGGQIMREFGTQALPTLAFKDTFTFKTDTLTSTRSDAMSGSSTNIGPTLAGVWVRVLQDNTIVAEQPPGDKLKAEGWQTGKPAARGRAGR